MIPSHLRHPDVVAAEQRMRAALRARYPQRTPQEIHIAALTTLLQAQIHALTEILTRRDHRPSDFLVPGIVAALEDFMRFMENNPAPAPSPPPSPPLVSVPFVSTALAIPISVPPPETVEALEGVIVSHGVTITPKLLQRIAEMLPRFRCKNCNGPEVVVQLDVASESFRLVCQTCRHVTIENTRPPSPRAPEAPDANH